jgi:hypothetical protein
VQLPLEAAEKADSQHLAYGYYLDGQSESDPRRSSYESRQTYYRMVTSALEAFDEMVEQIHASGRDVAGTMEERTREEAYDYALQSNDEVSIACIRPVSNRANESASVLVGQSSPGRELFETSRRQSWRSSYALEVLRSQKQALYGRRGSSRFGLESRVSFTLVCIRDSVLTALAIELSVSTFR